MYISIVIPVYNEKLRIAEGVKTLNGYFGSRRIAHEVIFVDDGSTDNTFKERSLLDCSFHYQIIRYEENKGKGYALKKGFSEAQGEFILFTDLDFSTPLYELDRFLELLKNDPSIDLLIGSRKMISSQVSVRQPFVREKLGEGFTILAKLLLRVDVTDFTCGFKLFKHDVGKDLFRLQKICRWGFDAEILYIASKKRYVLKEVPVTWHNDQRTRVLLLKDVWRSLFDIFLIRYYAVIGYYF